MVTTPIKELEHLSQKNHILPARNHMQFSVEVGEAANEHETTPRRNVKCKDAPMKRPVGFKASTVYEYSLECFSKTPNKHVMAWRDVIEVHEEVKSITKKINGKDTSTDVTWLYYELSPYTYITFKQLEQEMLYIGKGLIKIGMEPNGKDNFHIFASTSHKWMKMFLGAQCQSIPIATAYDTLGESGLTHSLNQTQSKGIFTDNSLLERLIGPLEKTTDLKYIVHFEAIDPKDKRQNGKIYKKAFDAVQKIKKIRPDIEIYSFDEIVELGKKSKDEIEEHPPAPNDTACIMYTSGSTGDPKGVVLSQQNVLAAVTGVGFIAPPEIGRNDRVMAFLPLAHIFELMFELESFYWGGILGYGTIKTLSSQSVRNCANDLVEFKPSIMIGVAALWETIRKGILAQLNQASPFLQKIFWAVYNGRLKNVMGSSIASKLIFRKIKAATGGNLKFAMNGGSKISTDAQEFISTVLCPLLLGYGLTESGANGTVSDPFYSPPGVAGIITGSLTMKLVDAEDLGYFAKDNKGEVWIQGPAVISEYYKNPEETAESITEDGWFKTGDIGEWRQDGQLTIIDRKKNLVKTLNGEYIALEKLESIYRSNPYVQNICVYADESKVKPIGIVVPNFRPLVTLAKSIGVMKENEDNIVDHLDDKKLEVAVLKEILSTGKAQGLGGIELLLGIVFVDEEWTPDNGFTTSAQKLKRREILAASKDAVDGVYKEFG